MTSRDEPSLRESPEPRALASSPMDEAKALQIISQTLAGSATELCRFEGGGVIFIRRDGVVRAMRNAASWVAEEMAGFGGIQPGRELLRSLDLGEASAPEQLEAAARLRLLGDPGAAFSGLRITLEVPVRGDTALHVQAFRMMGWDTERLLDAALSSLEAEIADFKGCPFHKPKESNRKDGSSPKSPSPTQEPKT